jgi:hypothetical protein
MEQIDRKSTKRLFDRVISELGDYSYFTTEIKGGKLHLKGRLDVGYGSDDSFNIEIVVSSRFPKSIPFVFELDNRIPVMLDRHFMTDDSGCCLVMPHQYREIYKSTMPFSDFIDKLVVPYFQNQIHFEITGEFVMGYAHGNYGLLEFYEEQFGQCDELTLFRLIRCVVMQRVAGHRPCPCGRSKKQRYCHGKGLIQLAEYGDLYHLRRHYIQLYERYRKRRRLEEAIGEQVSRTRPLDYISPAIRTLNKLDYVSHPKIHIENENVKLEF